MLKLLVGYFLELASWIVKAFLKVRGSWIGQDDYRSMAAEVRRLAGVFHLNHHAVILDECDGRPCSECGSYVCLVVEPYSLCYVSVQPEMERGRSPLVSIPPFGRDFQGIDTITRLSLSMVAFPQSPLPFRLARSL